MLESELDLLVIRSTVVSAEHVTKVGDDEVEPLNLKTFIRQLDIPVLVGSCTSYQAALHLMRTGAAGILVGVGTSTGATTADTFGVAKGDVFALHAAGAPRTVGGARGASAKAFALSMIFSMVVPPTRTGCRCLVCGSASGSVSRSKVCHSTLSRFSTPGRSLL